MPACVRDLARALEAATLRQRDEGVVLVAEDAPRGQPPLACLVHAPLETEDVVADEPIGVLAVAAEQLAAHGRAAGLTGMHI